MTKQRAGAVPGRLRPDHVPAPIDGRATIALSFGAQTRAQRGLTDFLTAVARGTQSRVRASGGGVAGVAPYSAGIEVGTPLFAALAAFSFASAARISDSFI